MGGTTTLRRQYKIEGLTISAGSGSRNATDYIDGSVLAELHEEGFFAALQKKYGKR